MFSVLRKLFGTSQERTLKKYAKIVAKINEEEKRLTAYTDEELKAKTQEFKQRIQAGATLDDLLVEAYAVVKNAARRMVGTAVHVSGYEQLWDMVPYDVQLQGAIALHKGYITEMQTGEGKTVTAASPLYLNSLTSQPIHIVTINDYLAERDCEWVGALLRWLGLSTGVLKQDLDFDERKAIYECDIVYGTASEFGFDYLRDNSIAVNKEDQVQRGHYYAVIDEIDSILIDEARTPLIISGPSHGSRQMYDVLKPSVESLVKKQKDFCTQSALEAKKILEKDHKDDRATAKVFTKEENDALRTLWLVSKGMPRNKVLRRFQEDPDMRAGLDKWDLYYYSEQGKDERTSFLNSLYIVVDEKANEYELTDKGILAWQECGGDESDFIMLDLGHEFLLIDNSTETVEQKMQQKLALQEKDAERKERAHNLQQMFRAHLLMEKDVDYIVQENKVVIIDEYTGRPQPGRRFSDGLHQAIEAKEDVPIQQETQTFATITLQNYFRRYKKLSGMTGTAITEAREFREIYKLDVLQVPTHHPCVREDFDDQMYMTEREKYSAILDEVKKVHQEGRPILIGTESVDVSEKLSRIFKLNRLPHVVLNAKNHAKEAEIIAHAGKRASITIATNMAGRGTDIKLEEGVAAIGGLYVIGSTRHQSRRIDRQLRGRSGRQGDRGSSRFYISLEDPLMRLFSSPIAAWLQRLRPAEGEPISAKILNRSIETAQKRIEGRNSQMRKGTLEYDDVMNKQREEIYMFRNSILHSENAQQKIAELLHTLCVQIADQFLVSSRSSWDLEGYRQALMHAFPLRFDENAFERFGYDKDAIVEEVYQMIWSLYTNKLEQELAKLKESFPAIEGAAEQCMNDTLVSIMIRSIDKMWQEHLLHMDHLRSEVHLRAVGQKDPLLEFKEEGFRLFEQLTKNLYHQIGKNLFKYRLTAITQKAEEEFLLENSRSLYDDLEVEEAPPPMASYALTSEKKKARNVPEPVFSLPKIKPKKKKSSSV